MQESNYISNIITSFENLLIFTLISQITFFLAAA